MNPLLLQVLFRVHHTPSQSLAPRFNYERDRFAFANETHWNYVAGEVRPQAERAPAAEKRYTRHCFVMVRAALQFLKFARFEAGGEPLPPDEMARRVRRVCRRPVWMPALPEARRIVFPGYPHLHAASAAVPGIFQDHIGKWWPIYWRPGNFPICLPVSGEAKSRLNNQMLQDLDAGYPTLLWIYNFPSLSVNHTIFVYEAIREPDRIRYRVYDPNYADAPKELQYEPATQTFTFEPTFYFKGGSVTPRAVYRGFFE